MESEVVNEQLGKVGHVGVSISGGKIVAEVDAGLPVGSAKIVLELDACAVLDAIAAAIPGTIDDAIIGVAKAALLGK